MSAHDAVLSQCLCSEHCLNPCAPQSSAFVAEVADAGAEVYEALERVEMDLQHFPDVDFFQVWHCMYIHATQVRVNAHGVFTTHKHHTIRCSTVKRLDAEGAILSKHDMGAQHVNAVLVTCDAAERATLGRLQVTAVIRPWRLPGVVSALSDQGIRGMTVADVAGIGFQGGARQASKRSCCKKGALPMHGLAHMVLHRCC